MSLPRDKDIEVPLLRAIAALGGSAKPRDIYPRVTSQFPHITQADLEEKTKTGANRWTNLIQFVRQHLVQKGEIAKGVTGTWAITDAGRKRIGAAPIGAPSKPNAEPEARLKPAHAFGHEQLVRMGRELGDMLGQVVETETGPVYKHDISWKENMWANPRLVIEICDKGNLDKDIQSLNWAAQNWKAKGILIIVDDKEYAGVAKKLAGMPVLTLKAEDFVKLHSAANSAGPDVLKLIFGS